MLLILRKASKLYGYVIKEQPNIMGQPNGQPNVMGQPN